VPAFQFNPLRFRAATIVSNIAPETTIGPEALAAEEEIIGECPGGDGFGNLQIHLMIDELTLNCLKPSRQGYCRARAHWRWNRCARFLLGSSASHAFSWVDGKIVARD
jgi:hypothetical protein